MATRFIIAWIASIAIAAHASPIIFNTPSYDTTALALADGPAGFDTKTGPPVPISSSATAGVNDFASASALATVGLFTSFAEADSFVDTPFALGQSHFVGTLLDYGNLHLVLNFDNLNFGGTGDLFMLLTNSISGTLVNNDLTTGGVYSFNFLLPKGGVTTLDLTLVSQAVTTGPGQSAQNFSQVAISPTSSIPLPATPFLVATGLAAMFMARRRRENAAAA